LTELPRRKLSSVIRILQEASLISFPRTASRANPYRESKL